MHKFEAETLSAKVLYYSAYSCMNTFFCFTYVQGLCFIPPGQLKKVVREGRSHISVYAGYVADDAELARFYTIISADGNKDVCSVVSMIVLLCLKSLLS